MPDAFLFLDGNWRIQFCNAAAVLASGRSKHSLLEKTYWEAWPAYTGTEIERRLRFAMASSQAIRFDYQDARSGPDAWLEIHAYPSNGGLAVQQHGGVSARKTSQQDARSLLTLVESIIEGTPDPIFLKDMEGRYVLANSACASVLGFSKHELRGKRDTDFLSEFFSDPLTEADRRVMTTGNTEVLEEWVLEDGEPRLYLSTKSPWRDSQGSIVGVIGVARDITVRKQVEEALRASQDRLQLALTAGQMGTWSHDLETGSIEWSDGHYRLWGMEPGECRPNLEIFRSRLHSGDRAHVKSTVEKAIASASDYAMQYRVVWPDDSVHWVEARGKVVCEQGRAVRTIGVVTDQTRRKRTEDKLRESARLESLGILAGGVAHDFNNLLTGIMGSASLIQEQVSKQSRLRPLVEQILAAGQRAADLTRQMLAYSGRSSFVVESVNLSSEITGILPLVKSSIGSNVELHLNLRRNLPSLAADPADMQQVIMNLAINAAEAIGSGVGSINISTGVVEIDACQAGTALEAYDVPAGEYVLLEVRDTGQGMEPEILTKIFDPFFTTKFTGRGLGLAAVQGIVRALKGALAVTSERGKGTTFRLYFPFDAARIPEHESLPAADASAAKCVLVVDEEAFVHRIAKSALEPEGYQVLVAENGDEAVAFLSQRKHRVDLVLLDLTIPLRNGAAALPEVKRLRPGTAVLASSGGPEAESLERFDVPIEGFIQKPYTARRLVRRVEEIIRTRFSGDRNRGESGQVPQYLDRPGNK